MPRRRSLSEKPVGTGERATPPAGLRRLLRPGTPFAAPRRLDDASAAASPARHDARRTWTKPILDGFLGQAPSLRTLLLTGLVALDVLVIGGITATVWAHERSAAHRRLHEDLRLRADTFAGLLEIDADGPEFELPARALPEYAERGSGGYAEIVQVEGAYRVRSPSLGPEHLAPRGPWEDGAYRYDALAPGPDGIPCEMVTHSFRARVEHEPEDGEEGGAATDAERRFQVMVAADARPRDAALAELRTFLALVAGGALVVTVAGGLLVARVVLRPIRRMTEEAARLTPDEPQRRLPPEAVVGELASLAETLNGALERLDAALARERRFASDASHELRTPLSVLLGNVELLLRRARTPDEYRAGLERQLRIAQRMRGLTENLLALARAESGRCDTAPVAFGDVVHVVTDELAPLAEDAGVALDAACEDVVVRGDGAALAALVQNLVANAVKYAPRGSTVRVRLARTGGDAVLSVADDGPGIAPEHVPHLFERFYRVSGGNDAREGAGIGLAIVDWIVRAHGGRIDVTTAPGRGTTFTVRLPAEPRAAPEPALTADA